MGQKSKNAGRKKQVRSKLTDMCVEADNLYKKAIEDGCDGLLDPVGWIANQDVMRKNWESYKKSLESNPLNFLMANSSFDNYMNHMYTKYPDGFGKLLKHSYKTGNNVEDEINKLLV